MSIGVLLKARAHDGEGEFLLFMNSSIAAEGDVLLFMNLSILKQKLHLPVRMKDMQHIY